MPLATQAEIEQYGQVDFTATPEPAVTLWRETATAAIESYCGRLFEQTGGVTETVDAYDYESVVRLEGYPVTAVNSVTEDGTALTADDDFTWYADGRVVRVSSGLHDQPWVRKRNAVVINYDYGWAEANVPKDLKMVCANIVLRIFHVGEAWANAPAGTAGPLTSLSLDGSGSASWDVGQGAATIGAVQLISGEDAMILNRRYVRRI